jgi:hypothetical protein
MWLVSKDKKEIIFDWFQSAIETIRNKKFNDKQFLNDIKNLVDDKRDGKS